MWKVIPGLPKYEASIEGEIRNKDTKLVLKQQICKNNKHIDYRLRLTTGGHNNAKTYKVHRLIAKTFLDNYSEDLVVDHIDGNSLNNKLSNLRMCTQKENVHNENTFKNFKGIENLNKLTLEKRYRRGIIVKDLESNDEKEYTSITIFAKEISVNTGVIDRVLKTGKPYKKKYLITYKKKIIN